MTVVSLGAVATALAILALLPLVVRRTSQRRPAPVVVRVRERGRRS
jgi:hypothetical protein